MANESTYSTISTLIGNIYETALLKAREQSVMSGLVTVFSSTGNAPRIWSAYSGGTFATITEATDMTAQTFDPAVAGTLTPAIYGSQSFITDIRIDTDTVQVVNDFGTHIGGEAGEHVDTNLVGLFTSFTGGTVGSAGGTLTWANIFRAQAYMRANKCFGRYACVMRPEQWYYLTSVSSGAPQLMVNNDLANGILGNFYSASLGNIDFFLDANITSGTAAVAGMFVPEAAALDNRRALRIENQRDASRGGGGWELNASMIYAYGVYRPTFGVKMIGTSV